MKSQKTIQVLITGSQGNTTSGKVEHRTWEKKERTVRALKALGAAWCLAIVAVFIPLLHFILVPILVISGPFVSYWMLGQNEIILGGTGQCPECHQKFEIVRTQAKWPISDLCNHCQSQVSISPTN